MREFRTAAALAAIATAALLGACGSYGIKGDRGLPPPPERMAYPNINEVPGEGRPVRSASDEAALKARLEASKPRVARSPQPFDPAGAPRARPPKPFNPAEGID